MNKIEICSPQTAETLIADMATGVLFGMILNPQYLYLKITSGYVRLHDGAQFPESATLTGFPLAAGTLIHIEVGES